MNYINSEFEKPKFNILWFFFIIFFLCELIFSEKIHIVLLVSILLQYFLLYMMYYIYTYYIQTIIKLRELPVHINFKKINLGFNFKQPSFNYSIKEDNYLMFEVYLHNMYYNDDFSYKKRLNENIKYHINTVWKHVLLYLKKYKVFLAKILMYCFFFGVILLLVSFLPNSLIDWSRFGTNQDIYKKIYIFFIFISFSFWLYITILILSSEALIGELKDVNNHEIYAIYNNSNIFLETEELLSEINRSNDLIGTYINISSSILYVSFLTILGNIL